MPGDPELLFWVPYSKPDGSLDNLSLFAGVDGFKVPGDPDLGYLGQRIGFNWGVPVFCDCGIGFQFGHGINYEIAVPNHRVDLGQFFTTCGLFQQTHWGIKWAAAVDYLYEIDKPDDFNLLQLRGLGGWEFVAADQSGFEVGIWYAFPLADNESGAEVAHPRRGRDFLRYEERKPLAQGDLYFQYTTCPRPRLPPGWACWRSRSSATATSCSPTGAASTCRCATGWP